MSELPLLGGLMAIIRPNMGLWTSTSRIPIFSCIIPALFNPLIRDLGSAIG